MSLSQSDIDSLLNRPVADRVREHRYRCAQAVVFGLPVVVLQYCGDRLGGHEAPRWVAVIQALMAGWVVCVGAIGMLSEGLLRWFVQRRLSPDLVAALAAIGFYLASLVSVLHLFVTGRLWYRPLWFHWSVILLAAWTALQWWRLSRPHPTKPVDERSESPDSSSSSSLTSPPPSPSP